MTLEQVLAAGYEWALENKVLVASVGCGVPVVGAIAARIGKAGKTDADGRFIASAVVGFSILLLVVAMAALALGYSAFHKTVLDADLVLLFTPLASIALSLILVRRIFPLTELGSVQTATDVGIFVAACIGVIWLASKFRGWGIMFFGSIAEMIAIGAFGIALMRRLYLRAAGNRNISAL